MVIDRRKLLGAWIFQMHVLSAYPSGNAGVEITPGSLASMSMLVFDGEQAEMLKRYKIESSLSPFCFTFSFSIILQ